MIAWSLRFLTSKFRAAEWGDSPRTMPSKRGNPPKESLLYRSSNVKTVADWHKLAAHHNKHCWRAVRWDQPSTSEIKGFSELFAISGCDAYVMSKQRRIYFKPMLSRVSWALAQISCGYCSYRRQRQSVLHRSTTNDYHTRYLRPWCACAMIQDKVE